MSEDGMIHVVSFSTGELSALALERVISRYGAENTLPVFMDTLIEDDDNYRFSAQIEARFGIPFVKLADGRTPYEVSHDEHVIPNSRLAPCTHRLKIEPFRAFLATLKNLVTVHIGYDFTEMHRCEATRKNYESLGYLVDFPMLWKPYEFRDYGTIIREEWGIEPPRMYAMGYTHANCGGCCVKQGQGDWIRTLINFPERYEKAEAWEREMRKNPINAEYAILKDRTLGETKALTLQELRERHERKQLPRLIELDVKSPCVVCGVGG